MLSYFRYIWKCILGAEVMFVGCIFYGLTLSGERAEHHQRLLEQLPFFQWGQPFPTLMTAISLSVYAATFGWYMVWMHNSSLKK